MKHDKVIYRHAAMLFVGIALGFIFGVASQCQEVGNDEQHDGASAGDSLRADGRWRDSPVGVAGSLVVRAYSQPQAPLKRDFHSYLQSSFTRSLILADYSVRILDAVSTRQVQLNPCHCMHEDQIGPIATSSIGMTAYSLGMATAVEWGAYKLWQHGHPKLARILQVGEIAGDGEAGIHNEWLNAQHGGK